MKDKAKTEGKLDNIIDSVTKRNLSILGEETTFGLTVKSLIAIAIGIASFVGLYYRLDAQIQEAKELPVQTISRTEFELKDELVRESVIDTKEKIEVVKKEIHDIKLQMNRIEDRLYEIKVSR